MKHRVTLVFLAFFMALFLFSISSAAKAQKPVAATAHKSVVLLDISIVDRRLRIEYQRIP